MRFDLPDSDAYRLLAMTPCGRCARLLVFCNCPTASIQELAPKKTEVLHPDNWYTCVGQLAAAQCSQDCSNDVELVYSRPVMPASWLHSQCQITAVAIAPMRRHHPPQRQRGCSTRCVAETGQLIAPIVSLPALHEIAYVTTRSPAGLRHAATRTLPLSLPQHRHRTGGVL